MLTFIVPLKSAQSEDSWEHVSRLFKRTIASACAQTSSEFRVVVVCHDIPDGNWTNPRLEIISVDHLDQPKPIQREMRKDVQRKRLIGLNRALELSPTHIMFLNSDDCVSKRLAEFVAHNPDSNGWYFRSGYFYSERQERLHLERWRYSQWCGSGHIVRPEHLDYLQQASGGFHILHTELTRELRQHGNPLQPLPFHGGVYCVSHGENFHDYEPILWPSHPLWRSVRRLVCHRALTPGIRDEFGLYPVGGADKSENEGNYRACS